MNQIANLSELVPTVHPPRLPRRPTPKNGEVWHVKMPKQLALVCVQVDEVTPRTVVLRKKSDVGQMFSASEPAFRYERRDIKFVERAPE